MDGNDAGGGGGGEGGQGREDGGGRGEEVYIPTPSKWMSVILDILFATL